MGGWWLTFEGEIKVCEGVGTVESSIKQLD